MSPAAGRVNAPIATMNATGSSMKMDAAVASAGRANPTSTI
jgi:hypothetical protein